MRALLIRFLYSFLCRTSDRRALIATYMRANDPRGGVYRRASFFPAVIVPPGRAGNTAMASDHADQSRQNRLLAALTPADHSLLVPHLKELSLELGTILHEAGELVEHIYFPHDGMVSLLAMMSDGQNRDRHGWKRRRGRSHVRVRHPPGLYEGSRPVPAGSLPHFHCALSNGAFRKVRASEI